MKAVLVAADRSTRVDLGAGVVCLACLIMFAPARAVAADVITGQAAPIRVERCSVQSRSLLQDPFNGLRAQFVSGLTIKFTNVRSEAVTAVAFFVRYQGSSETIVDRGSFAPNVSIDRTFANFAGEASGSDAALCTVSSVLFADKTLWTVPPK